MSPHLTTLTLHRLRYGELDADTHAAVRSHLDACERCRRRLSVQERARDAFVLQPVPPAIVEAARPSRPRALVGWIGRLLPVAVLAAAVATFTVIPALREMRSPLAVEQTRTKGDGPALEIWIDRGGPRALREGEALRAGDRVQVLYDPRGAAYVTLAGRDPTGAVEVWRTLTPERPGLQPAPFALTLDDTPGYQEIFVIGSRLPITTAEAERAVAGRPVANVGTVESVLLPKD